ncbi:Serine/threonine-protein kinase, active site [Sesbania bispinosa]|nr:Serine/threonine-protein kinase, active site [Sesbania bispinosa]
MIRSTTTTLLLLAISFLYGASALLSDGVTLLSLLTSWTFVPSIISSSWNASDSIPCSWVGVQCDHAHNVISLNLTHQGIFGQLGPQVGNLYHLQTFVLLGNGFSGKVPSELSNCSLLQYLDLSGNNFSGQIPYSFKKLQNLQYLSLSSNLLTGEIPVSIWRITSLKHILVHNNSLFGELPLEMTKLKHLKNISLFDNQFSGVIPQSLGINSSLVKLDCMNNKFTGNIPPNLCFGKQLIELNMGINQLQGGIPSDVGRCATLRRLILKENNFTGSLPDFESNPNLIYMDISKNNISGLIPSSLGNCRNLTYINLSMNNFTGPTPSQFGKLVNLVILDLAHNNLEGTLPPQLSNCTKMDRFDVGFNFLNGSLPSSLSSWTGITTLILRENHFSGGIPDFLAKFNNLRELQLGGNLFGGKIPQSIGTLQNLFYGLNLSANGLTGDIPAEISNLKLLQSLDISLNNLTGKLDFLGSLISLIEVNISYNFFDGPVPMGLMKLLNSSPSSFMGNPLLCVSCLSCIRTIYVKPCVYKSSDHKGISKFQIVMIELGSSIFVSAMLLITILMYLRRKELKTDYPLKHHRKELKTNHPLKFQSFSWRNTPLIYDQIMEATENLNDRYIIGIGAYGVVYKAQLVTGHVVAVKKVSFGRNKEKRASSMQNEIQTIGTIRHRNLVKLFGFFFGPNYGLIIYDYIENGSLHDILHEMEPPPPLKWNVRFNIAVGIAQGLAYLHYDCIPPIVHRDIKPKNILLDADMEPLIADFGTALYRNLSEDSNTYFGTRRRLSSNVVGTPGYIAPGKIEKIADPYLASAFPNSAALAKQVTALFLLALQCTEREPHQRPTMKDVIGFYNVFQLRCDDVVYGDEVVVDVAPQPCDSLNLLSDVPVVSADQHLHGETESSSAATLRQREVTFNVGIFPWDDWKLMSRPATGIDGLVIKPMGSGKIQVEKVVVAALIVPKITYAWSWWFYLPSITGPVVTTAFNWFFLSRWVQYMHQQKALYSQPKSYFINTKSRPPTNSVSSHGRIPKERFFKANTLQSLGHGERDVHNSKCLN